MICSWLRRLACALPVVLLASVAHAQFPPYPGTQPIKAANSPTVSPGGEIRWTITIFNDASSEDAAVTFSDDVPDPADGLPVQPWTIAGDLLTTPAGSVPSYNGDNLSISNITVPGNGSVTIVFRTRVLASAANQTRICNVAVARYDVEICSGNPPLCSGETYRSATRPPGGTAPEATCVTVDAPSPLPDLRALAASSADSCPFDPAFPQGSGSFSPGETLSLTLPIENGGGQDAAGQPTITGTLQAGAGFTIVTGSSPYTTTVQPNVLLAGARNQGTNSTPFVVRVNPGIACPGTLRITLQVTSIQGGPYSLSYDFPIGGTGGSACLPKCLDLALTDGSPAVTDTCAGGVPGGNGQIEPGESLSLLLPVDNAGPDPLNGSPTITATLASLDPAVTVTTAGSTYPNIAAGASSTNATAFVATVDPATACGTPFTLRLTLANTEGGSRTVDFPLQVAGRPCTVCGATPCSAQVSLSAAGPLRYCQGGTVDLTAAATFSGCGGTSLYQWLENGTPIPGATGSTYTVPTNHAPGSFSFTASATCSTDPSCSELAQPVSVTIDPTPLVVRRLLGVKRGLDVAFSWTGEPTASGGYRLYETQDKTLIPQADAGGPAGVSRSGQTSPDPLDTTLSLVGALPPPPDRLFYQAIAVCSDDLTEGPH